jgi:predicted transcriptional regulator of viral defense system
VPHACAHKHRIDAQRRERGVDAAIAALAGSQHGVVSREQLLGLGLGRGAVAVRLQRSGLHALHRGVYAVGHRALGREARWLAAVLASGSGAALSHRSAAALWGIRASSGTRVEVAVPHGGRSKAGIHVHRIVLAADERTVERAIPVTTPARTLLDLAAVLPPHQIERAIEQAEVLRLSDAIALEALVARHPRRAGTRALRRILGDARIGETVTRSELERRFLVFLDDHGLPRPLVNAPLELPVGWIEADCLWRAERLVVELDGYASHGTRTSFERDRARDRALQVAGWRVLRITWRHLRTQPDTVAADLRRLLAGRGYAAAGSTVTAP